MSPIKRHGPLAYLTWKDLAKMEPELIGLDFGRVDETVIAIRPIAEAIGAGLETRELKVLAHLADDAELADKRARSMLARDLVFAIERGLKIETEPGPQGSGYETRTGSLVILPVDVAAELVKLLETIADATGGLIRIPARVEIKPEFARIDPADRPK